MSIRRFHIEGDFLLLIDPAANRETFVKVIQREQGRIDYKWSEYIAAGVESGPEAIDNIEPFEDNHYLFQGLYGIRESILLYKSMPSNVRLGGFPKFPKATSANRKVGAVDNISSPFENPDWETEFFLRGSTTLSKLHLDAFNYSGINIKPRIRFVVNKMLIEEVTDAETVGMLQRGEIPYRPVTLGGLPSTRGEVIRG